MDDLFNLGEFRNQQQEEGMRKAGELTSFIQGYIRKRFGSVSAELVSLVNAGLLAPETVSLMYEIAVVAEVQRLYEASEGNIDTALELANAEATKE